jgi:hypothetical protein
VHWPGLGMSTEIETDDYCFVQPEDVLKFDYEIIVEALYQLTGKCFCNLCKANGWGGYSEDT